MGKWGKGCLLYTSIISLLDDWKAKQPPELGKPEKKADLEK